MDGRALVRARQRLAEQKERNTALRDAREAEAYRAIPALRDTDAHLRALVGEVIGITAAHSADAERSIAEISARSEALCAQRAELLTAHGYPADWLDEIVSCPRCRDTGYLRSGALCDCLRALYEEEKAKELNSALRLGEETFADFSLDYYTGAAYDCMKLTKAYAEEYAVGFNDDSANLLMQGGTGLGKTMLSGCIAKVVSAGGRSVVYETAQEAFAAFEEQKFIRDGESYAAAAERVRRILSCDLLILDDLGTELTTSFTQSALYQIVNTRLMENRKTIISTNLTDEELAARYTPQTVSRISGEYDTLVFLGRDIRAIRKERRYD